MIKLLGSLAIVVLTPIVMYPLMLGFAYAVLAIWK
jgi:hypothetical protein